MGNVEEVREANDGGLVRGVALERALFIRGSLLTLHRKATADYPPMGLRSPARAASSANHARPGLLSACSSCDARYLIHGDVQ